MDVVPPCPGNSQHRTLFLPQGSFTFLPSEGGGCSGNCVSITTVHPSAESQLTLQSREDKKLFFLEAVMIGNTF
jgi:hypothetical protein